jgi:hypothetical protein
MLWAIYTLGCTEPPEEPLGSIEPVGPIGPLGYRLSADLTEPDRAWAWCVADGIPGEEHLVESPEPQTHHELAVMGLLAETDYRCEVHAGALTESVPVRTGALPELSPWLVQGEAAGYTVFNTQRGIGGELGPSYVVMVDGRGEVRWLYEVGTELVCDLDVQVRDGVVHIGGGWAGLSVASPNRGVFRDLDLQGNVLLDRTVPDFGMGFNHHSELLPDGTYLSLTGSDEAVGDNDWVGVGVERWSPTDGVLWSWSTQPLIDAGVMEEPAEDVRTPYTANAVALVVDPLGPGAWISSYSRQELWRIDLATSQPTHLLGPGVGFSVEDANGNALPSAELPHTQHDPQFIDGPLGPDTRVLLYDNGLHRPGGEYSRVVEYDLDLEREVMIRLWSWTEPGWFDPTMGGVQRLPDDHVLVAQGFNRNRSPGSSDSSSLVELGPLSASAERQVVWRLDLQDQGWPVYRGERIDGCAVFGNLAQCEALAERLAELQDRPEGT